MPPSLGRAVLEITVDEREYQAAMGRVSDTARGTVGEVQGVTDSLDFSAFAAYAAGAAAAVVAVGAAVVELGTRGAAVADVSGSFQQLSGNVGETSQAMLGALRRGVDGTISDFNLMRTANTALGAGLRLSAQDMGTVAAGAKMLADRVGGDTQEAFNALTRAMITGRTTGLAEFGFKASDVASILPQLRSQLAAAGDGGRDFADEVDSARAMIDNLHDSLGLVTSGAVLDLVAQFRNAGIEVGDFSGVATAAMNVVANGLVNMVSIGVNGITGLVQSVTAGGTTIASQAEQIWGALTGEIGVADALRNIAAIGVQGFEGIRAGIERSLTPTITWRDYLASADSAVRTVTASTNALTEADRRRAIEAERAWQRELEAVERHNQAIRSRISDLTVNVLGTSREAALQTAYQFGLLETGIQRAGMTIETMTTTQLLAYETELVRMEQLTRADVEANNAVVLKLGEVRARLYDVGIGLQQVGMGYQQTTATAQQCLIDLSNSQSVAHDQERMRAQQELNAARANYQALLQSGTATAEQLTAAWQRHHDANEAMGETNQVSAMQRYDTISSAASQSLRAIFGQNKNAAIAAAIIDTASAVIKSYTNAGGFPWGLIPAAMMAAAGAVQISRIRSQSYEVGTPGLDFANFGTESFAALHRQEAVIPRGGGHLLAGEIAAAMPDAGNSEQLDRIAASLDDLPFTLTRAWKAALATA